MLYEGQRTDCIGPGRRSVAKDKENEKIFIPKHQKKLYDSMTNRGTLFG